MSGMLERLLIVIEAKADGAVKGIRDVEAAADSAGKPAGPIAKFRGALHGAGVDAGAMLKTAGLAVGAFVASGVGKFKDLTEQVQRVKQVSGETAEEASRLVAVSDDFGVSAETVGRAMAKLAQGGASDTKAKLIEVANAFAATQDPAERARIGTEAFGKQWQEMAVLLEQGGAKIEEAFAGVSDAQVIDEAELQKGRDLRLAMDNVTDAADDLAIKAAEVLVPALSEVANVAADVLSALDDVGVAMPAIGAAIGFALGGGLGAIAGAAIGAAAQESTDMAEELGQSLGDALAAGMDRSTAKETVKGLRDALGPDWENIVGADAAMRLKATAGEVKLLSGSFTETGRAARDAALGIKTQQEASADAARATDEYRERVEGNARAQRDLQDAVGKTTNTVWGQVDAARAAKEANQAAAEKIGAAAEAQYGNAEANDDALEAIQNAAEAAGNAAQKQAEMAGASDGASKNVQAQIAELDKLRASLDPSSPLYGTVSAWIEHLKAIPTNIVTTMTVRSVGAGIKAGVGVGGGWGDPENPVNLSGGLQRRDGLGAQYVVNVFANAVDGADIAREMARAEAMSGSYGG